MSGRRAWRPAQPLVIWSLVLALLLLVLGAGLIVLRVGRAGHDVAYTALVVGDCFDHDRSTTGIFRDRVSKVACGKPHDGEVFGIYDDASTGAWPGARAFEAPASTRCSTFADQYLTGPRDGLSLSYIYPVESSWQAGMRRIVCEITNDGGSKRTGSSRGAGSVTTTT